MISYHLIIPLVAFLLNILLFAITLLRNYKSAINRTFALFLLSLAIWNYGVYSLRLSPDEVTAYFWEKFIHLGVTFIPAFYFHFVLFFIGKERQKRKLIYAGYLISLFFLALSPSKLFMQGVIITYWGYAPKSGPLYPPFFLYFQLFMTYSTYLLIKEYRLTESSFRRNRMRYLIIGAVTSLSGGAVDFVRFLTGLEKIYPIGIPANIVLALSVGIAIIRYRLVDVNLILKRALLYILMAGALTFAASIALSWYRFPGDAQFQLPLIYHFLGLIFASFLVYAIWFRRIESFADRLIHKSRHGCHESLMNLSKNIGFILEPDELSNFILSMVVERVGLKNGSMVIYDEESGRYITRARGSLEGDKPGRLDLDGRHPLIDWFGKNNELIIAEEVSLNPKFSPIRSSCKGELRELRSALIIPLKAKGKLHGFLTLGDKLTGDVYDQKDLELLSVLAAQVAVAIENAQLYQKINRVNEKLGEINRDLAKKIKEISKLHDMGISMQTTMDMNELTRIALKGVVEGMGFDRAMLMLLDENTNMLTGRASEGGDERQAKKVLSLRLPVSMAGELLSDTIMKGKVHTVLYPGGDSRLRSVEKKIARDLGSQSFATVPLMVKGRAIGLIAVDNVKSGKPVKEENLKSLVTFANQIATTLENAKLYESVAMEKERLEKANKMLEETYAHLVQSEKMAAVGRMAADIAHEVNNPLAIIKTSLSIIDNHVASERVDSENLKVMEEEIDRIARIIRQLLDFSKPEVAGVLSTNLTDMIDDVLKVTGGYYLNRGIKVEGDFQANLPAAKIPPDKMKQVLLNLLKNAEDAMPHGGKLYIGAHVANGAINLRVSDTGMGISGEHLEKIFDPFFTTKGKGKGTGLGLSVTYGIVKSYNGSIKVESKVGHGTTFTVSLPLLG